MSAPASSLKVLIVHNYPTPYRIDLFAWLAERCDLQVWFCGAQEAGRQWKGDPAVPGAATVVLPHISFGRALLNPTLLARLLRVDVDVLVLAEDPFTMSASLAVRLASRMRRTPLVVWSEHVARPPAATMSVQHRARNVAARSYLAFRRSLLRGASAVASMSADASTAELRSLGWRGPTYQGTQVVPKRSMPLVDRAERATDGPLLFLGYLRPEKNVAALIESFLRVSIDGDRLVIAGGGPQRAYLEEVAGASPRITFVGNADPSMRDDLLRSAAGLVLPSLYEPWGLVVNEALYCGVPVILSNRAGAAALIQNGVNGLLIDPASPPELDRALDRFLHDSGLRRDLTEQALKVDQDALCGSAVGFGHLLRAIEDASVSAAPHRSGHQR